LLETIWFISGVVYIPWSRHFASNIRAAQFKSQLTYIVLITVLSACGN
jgi:hypothetical protein